jgi:hypothetical protein
LVYEIDILELNYLEKEKILILLTLITILDSVEMGNSYSNLMKVEFWITVV